MVRRVIIFLCKRAAQHLPPAQHPPLACAASRRLTSVTMLRSPMVAVNLNASDRHGHHPSGCAISSDHKQSMRNCSAICSLVHRSTRGQREGKRGGAVHLRFITQGLRVVSEAVLCVYLGLDGPAA